MNKIKEKLIWFGKSLLWLIPLLILLDFGTKMWAFYGLQKYDNDTIVIIEHFFSFRLQFNKGAAWSWLEGETYLLAGISVVFLIAFSIYFAKKYKTLKTINKIIYMLVIAGCAGNMIDRVFQHVPGTPYYNNGVIDFLSFKLIGKNGYDFPVFNVADMCLVIGVFMLVGVMIVEQVELYKAQKELGNIKEKLAKEINSDGLTKEDKDEMYSLISKLEVSDLKEKDIMYLKELINECYEKYPFLKEKKENVL